MSVKNPIGVKSFFSAIIIILMLLTGGCVYPATPIEGRSLGNNTAAQARTKLLAAAESYLGTPYRYGGADSRGLDCSGLVFVSFRDALDIQVPRSSSSLYSWTARITAAEMKPGDLVFFNTTGKGVSHVGIYTGNNLFIHAPSEGVSTGVMYSSLDESYYKRTFVGAGRAIPWDQEAEKALTNNSLANAATPNVQSWSSTGLFAGLGVSSAFGGFFDGSVFRGISLQAKIGYKGFLDPSLYIALEIRPAWDRLLGVYRLPVTLALGNDTFQVFAGPAFVFGEPVIGANQRAYNTEFNWLGEIGASYSFRSITVSSGSLSLFTELAWQSYTSTDGRMNLLADLAANLRFSMGLRYLSLINL